MDGHVGWRELLGAIGINALPVLAPCLRGAVLRDVALTGRSTYLRAALLETGLAEALGESATLAQALQRIFELLAHEYRCDYVYRSAITSRLFLKRRSPTTTTLLSEFRVWRSRADLAMFNGTSVAYEIKSELDKLGRLETQLRDYSGLFDRIFVVTHEANVAAVRAEAPPHVGILVLGKSLSFKLERAAASNVEQVRTDTIVDALRREEIVSVTRRVTGAVPASSRVGLVDECARALAQHRPRDVHDAMVTVVKKRARLTRCSFEGIAPELVGGYMESGLAPNRWSQLSERLTHETVGTLIAGHGQVLPLPAGQDL